MDFLFEHTGGQGVLQIALVVSASEAQNLQTWGTLFRETELYSPSASNPNADIPPKPR